MKKKHRRAVYFISCVICLTLMTIIISPFGLLGLIGIALKWIWDYAVFKPTIWILDRLIEYGNDSDYEPKEKKDNEEK